MWGKARRTRPGFGDDTVMAESAADVAALASAPFASEAPVEGEGLGAIFAIAVYMLPALAMWFAIYRAVTAIGRYL